MGRMSREQLKDFRQSLKAKVATTATEKNIRIVVGMGTCGIAAGAKHTFNAIDAAVKEAGIQGNVELISTSCMGLCYKEPTVEVAMPGMPKVIYGNITQEKAKDFIRKHILEKRLLDGHILDRPATDINNS